MHVTDQEPMLALMEHNIVLNGLQGKAVASVYDWGSTRPKNISEHPDVVLAGKYSGQKRVETALLTRNRSGLCLL